MILGLVKYIDRHIDRIKIDTCKFMCTARTVYVYYYYYLHDGIHTY